MSRCFPYTPPMCVRKGLNGEAALIESIKLQKATEKGKTSRKREEIKDKTGKTKEERNKLSGDCGVGKVKRSGDQKNAKEERKAGSKRKLYETRNEQVEKSDLSVECGRPFLSRNTGSAKPSHCDDPKERRVIRIRLTPGNCSGRKREIEHKQFDNSYVERPNATIQRPKDNSYVERQTATIQRLKAEAVPSDNNKPEFSFPCCAEPDNKVSTSSRDKKSSCTDGLHGLVEVAYRNLTDNWTPLPLHLEDRSKDSDWLFGTGQLEKRSKNPIAKRQKSTIDNHKSSQSSSLWPRAQYLPEGGLYALPYTVPF